MAAEPGCMGFPVKQRGRRTRVTSTAQKPKVELLACGTKVEKWAQQAGVTMAGVRTTEKLKGRSSPVEPRGWRVAA